MKTYQYKDLDLLKKFMDEQFDLKELVKIGLIDKNIEGNYPLMANRICEYFGYESIYQYGAETITAHISYTGRVKNPPMIETFKNIYD